MERLDRALASAVRGRPILMGVPFDGNSSHMQGAAEAPSRIRETLYSDAGNLWTEHGIDLGKNSALADAGDLDLPDGPDCSETIKCSTRRVLTEGMLPIALGGDHSVTDPLVRAFEDEFDALELLHFDAHPDLHDSFDGARSSHACPFARIMERGRIRRLVQVGIRATNGHQREQARRFGVEVIEMNDLGAAGSLVFSGPVYVSVDVDVLDPAFAPGVSHREPGGVSTRELIQMLHRVEGRVVGADVVELNPRRDRDGITASACAKIVKEIAGRMLRGQVT